MGKLGGSFGLAVVTAPTLWMSSPPEISRTGQEVGMGQEITDFQASMLVGTILNTKSRK